MRFMRSARGSRHSLVSIIGIVCIALVLITGVLQVTHTHPNGQPDHDCSLCVTAHNVAQAVVVVTLAITTQAIGRLVAETFAPLPRQRFVLRLAIRPPPVPSTLA